LPSPWRNFCARDAHGIEIWNVLRRFKSRL
jgi:hypothetical protein